MISALTRAWDNLLGVGEAAVTVPPLDGALLPNRLLDEADVRLPLEGVDSLATVGSELLASSGKVLHVLGDEAVWGLRHSFETEIAAMAATGDGLAVALASGDIVVEGGRLDGHTYRAAPEVTCITALAVSGGDLYVANGAAQGSPDDWQRDLLQRGASGSIWKVDLESGASSRIAGGIAYPAGLAVDGGQIVYSEAWRHRLVRIDAANPGQPQVLHTDLPGYPGRIAPAAQGYWLSVFAPRTQLVEFVLREPGYRKRMIAEVPRPYWVAPTLRTGRSFYEPLQGGSVKHLGLLKPWAPTMSAGLCIRLDDAFQPSLSLHSRADGATHGVTSVVEFRGRIWAAARGDGLVVAIPLGELGDGA